MRLGNQFARCVLALGLAAGAAYPCVAQRPRSSFVRQQNPKPPKPPKAQRQQQRQQARNQNEANANRPANAPANKPQGNAEAGRGGNPNGNLTPRQQLGVGAARPWVDRMRDISPEQRESVLRNSRAFQNLPPQQQNNIRRQFQQWDRMSPQQRADQRTKEETWRHLTPEQREHIKYDVLPKWRQMPPERQQAIQRRLGVLQNMPESARNQRLNDPNFTRGMSDEDKETLRDLSHLHVGGAPDPPGGE